MRLAQKLVLFALAVALVPLAATGFSLIRLGEEALRARIAEHQGAAAVAVAAKVAQAVEELARRVETVMGLVVVTELRPAERIGVARMLYRQSRDIAVTVLVDRRKNLLAAPEYLAASDLVGELAGHPAAVAEDAARLLARLPLPAAGAVPSGAALVSPVYFAEDAAARVAMAVPCCADARGFPAAFAGIELALRGDVLRVEGIEVGERSVVFVVDREGRVIAHPRLPVGTELAGHGAVAAALRAPGTRTAVYAWAGGRYAAAMAPVGGLGWLVVVEQPEAVAYRAATRMRQQTLAWVLGTTLVVLLSGFIFAARLRRVLRRMTDGAKAFGEGRLGRRIEVQSRDELGELAGTMNDMAARLLQSLRELESWGLTLEQRVAERTRELQSTQAQLLNQSKLAAIGQLGAGVAHEINNPLAGVLGLVQLLLRGRNEADPDWAKLKDVEAAAKRCRDIVMRLLRFSEHRVAGRTRLNLNDLLGEVLDMVAESFAGAAIRVERELDPQLPQITADPGALAQVFVNILQNSRNAMPKGGTVRVRTARVGEDRVRAEIDDSGEGIAPEHLPRIFEPFFTTKRVWTDIGLGLSVAYRVVADHGGTIEAQSELGKGTRLSVTLPLEPPEPATEALPPRRTVLLE